MDRTNDPEMRLPGDACLDPERHSNLNDPGEDLWQRLVYRAARCKTHDDWARSHRLASELLERYDSTCGSETLLGNLLNALCEATHKVRQYQHAVDRMNEI